MDGASDRSVYNGQTSHASSPASAAKTQKSLSRKAVESYMSTKNEGGDPVTALALRPESPSKSIADRQAQVGHDVVEALKKLNGTS